MANRTQPQGRSGLDGRLHECHSFSRKTWKHAARMGPSAFRHVQIHSADCPRHSSPDRVSVSIAKVATPDQAADSFFCAAAVLVFSLAAVRRRSSNSSSWLLRTLIRVTFGDFSLGVELFSVKSVRFGIPHLLDAGCVTEGSNCLVAESRRAQNSCQVNLQ